MEICQYMSLEYFLCLLESKQYHVNCKHTFSDLNERRLPLKKMFKLYLAKGDGYCPQPTKEQLDADMDELDKKLRQYRGFNLPTACWTSSTSESAVLWNHFAPKMGVCIHSTIDRFVNSLSVESGDIFGFNMEYCGYNGSMNVMECLCSKEKCFQLENEVRFYFKSSKHRTPEIEKQQHIKIPVDIETLIERVVLSPDIPPLAANNLRDTFKEKYGLEVSSSKIAY